MKLMPLTCVSIVGLFIYNCEGLQPNREAAAPIASEEGGKAQAGLEKNRNPQNGSPSASNAQAVAKATCLTNLTPISLKLQEATSPSYTREIKAFLDGKCIGCHGASPIAPPSLNTYASAAAAAEDSLLTIENGTMPPGMPITDQNIITTFQAWVAGGVPESLSADTSEGPGEPGDHVQQPNPAAQPETPVCEVPQDEEREVAAWADPAAEPAGPIFGSNPLLLPGQVQACHQQDAVFDRTRNGCSADIRVGEYKCTWYGVWEAFALTGSSVGDALKNLFNEGWLLDQCGQTVTGKPIVFFLKELEEQKIRVKRFARN